MSLSSLSRALARSARSSRQRQGSLLGGHGGLRASSPPLPCGELGFLRSYVTSVIGNRAAVASGAGKDGDWRFLLASRQFRRLFSDKSKKNHGKHSEEENKGKGDESDKSDSKMASFTSLGIGSPLNSSSFNLGSSSMPERHSMLGRGLKDDQTIFSSLGADPVVKTILVMAEQSTSRRLSHTNSSFLKHVTEVVFQLELFQFWKPVRSYNGPWASGGQNHFLELKG
uniref:Uncharacterized protein n=1 Tax=Oryza barthii TaxID=65489 RepID=A0A0D3GFN8_9ORYZ